MNSFKTMLSMMTLIAVAFAAGGCNAVDRAGGKAADPVTTLTFAQPNDHEPPDQVQAFADEVERASGGSLKIDFDNSWRLGETNYEVDTIGDVKDGKADFAWVGARAFDRVGVTDFQALLAPTLVDSIDLEAAVFADGIPEEMMAGTNRAGVTGVGVLPGPMRMLLGFDKALEAPGDFRGTVVGMQDSALTQTTLEALGAATKALPSGAKLDGVDAYEQQLASINGNGYLAEAGYVTANLDLWPRPLVLIANPEAYDALTDAQRATLTEASTRAILPALDASRAEDIEGAKQLCAQGMAFTRASAADLASLTNAWQPVYDDMAADTRTARWLDRIESLKMGLGVGPDTVRCHNESSTETGAAQTVLPDGTYRTTLTLAATKAGCHTGDPGAEYVADQTTDMTLELQIEGDHILQTAYPVGHIEERGKGWVGTYRTFRDTFELIEEGFSSGVASTYDFDGKRLLLTDMQTDQCDGKVVWTDHPWILLHP